MISFYFFLSFPFSFLFSFFFFSTSLLFLSLFVSFFFVLHKAVEKESFEEIAKLQIKMMKIFIEQCSIDVALQDHVLIYFLFIMLQPKVLKKL